MIIYLNDLALGAPGSGIFIDEEVEGLNLPAIRTSSGVYAGSHGGYIGAQFFDNRSVSIPGRVFSSNVDEALTKRREITSALVLYPTPMTVRIVDDDGSAYTFDAVVIDFKMPIKRDRMMSQFKLELLATDPLIYDDTAGSELSTTLERTVGGGIDYPMTWPIVWEPGTQPTTVTNGGISFVFPTITLTGLASNPSVTNVTTGERFKLDDLTTTDGDVIVIDMKNRTVTLNGGSIYNKRSSDSQWWGLPVGASSIALDSAGGGDTITGTISWRSGYLGI